MGSIYRRQLELEPGYVEYVIYLQTDLKIGCRKKGITEWAFSTYSTLWKEIQPWSPNE